MASQEQCSICGAGLIPRPALIRKLDCARNRRLTLIQAPAGYGKTALLHQWRAALELNGARVSWVTFTEKQWTPAAWIQTLANEVAAGVRAEQRADRGPAGEEGAAQLDDLLARLQAISSTHLIFLDAYENCDTQDIGSVINQLLARLPLTVHLVIACRRRPHLQFAKLYATGVATLIAAADLQFSSEETATLLQPLLPPERIVELHQLSEGWAIVLRLARLWLEGGRDPASVVAAACDPREETAMFLAEQVIGALPADERDFLIDTSELDCVTPELADHMLVDESAVKHLHSLHALFPLVRPSGAGSSNVCVHPVLRKFLRHLLAEKGLSHTQLLNRRAAEWYADKHDLLSAVRHAVKSGQPHLGEQLFEGGGGVSLLASGHSMLEQVFTELSVIPQLGEHERPSLTLAKLIRESLSREVLESKGRLEQLKAEIANVGSDPALRPEAMIAEAWFQALLDEAPSHELLDELESAVADDGSMNLGIRVLAAAYVEMCSLQRGDLRKIERDDAALSNLCRENNFPYQQCYSLIYRGIGAQLIGDYRRALALADEAAGLARGLSGPTRYQPVLSIQTLKAEVLFDIGAFQDANLLVRSTVELLEGEVTCFDVYAPLLRVTFGLTQLGNGTEQALEALRVLARKARPAPSVRLNNLLLAHETSALAMLNCAECDLAAIESVWRQLKDDPAHVTWREMDAVGLAYARASIASGQYTTAEATLHELHGIAHELKWHRTLVDVHLLRAWIHLERCESLEAVRALNEAIELAQPRGIRAPFLNAAEVVAHVSSMALGRGAPADSIKFAKEIIRTRKEISGPYKLPFLTPAEHSVLLELVQGAANKVIARRLNVTENTVKTHLKNIFRKTSLQSREEAIGFARKYLI